MSDWSSEQYLKFKSQRTQPAVDLAERITADQPKNILDIGCGPGNSTAVLRERFPGADILGVDNSENMIDKAKASYPDLNFRICDVACELDKLDTYDVIFSNACLQWIPSHLENEIAERAAEIYGKHKNGEIIFKFRRFFFTAAKV